jgi:hypothetical protein
MNGQAIAMGTGVRSAGTQRVTIATDDSVPITGTVTTIPPANASTNLTQVNGVAVNTGIGTGGTATLRTAIDTAQLNTNGQKTMAGSAPVVLASDQSAIPVTGTVTANVGTTNGLALDTSLATTNTEIGIVTETAPATDTASSGLNGRLQRIAQRLTSLIALLPTALGQGTMAQGLKVVLPSDQSAIPVTLTSTTITGTASENLAQVNGVTTLTGAGATGTGSQRTTVAQDSTTIAGSATLPAGTNTIGNVNQTLATAGFAKVTDGTNTMAVKAASVAPVATDPAGVVTISPNGNTVIDTVVDATATGTITTQNLVPAGVATAGSAVEIALNGQSSLSVQVTGVYTGVLSLQETVDGTNWITTSDSRLVLSTGGYTPTIPSATQNIYQVAISGVNKIRITGLAAMTGTATVTLRASRGAPNILSGVAFVSSIATVSNVSSVNAVIPGTAATNLGKSRNLAIGATDTGVGMLALRNDALTAFGTSGNYNTPITDIFGALIAKNEQLHKRTYRCAFVVAPAATATDVFQLIGSATTTVEVTKIVISGTQTTGGMSDIFISKRSTANTGGTSTASVNVPMLSTDAAATAVGAIYTANPTTTGTAVGDIEVRSVPLSVVTATTNNSVEYKFGENGRPVQLVGVAQAIAIRLNGATLTGGSLKITVEFTEF